MAERSGGLGHIVSKLVGPRCRDRCTTSGWQSFICNSALRARLLSKPDFGGPSSERDDSTGRCRLTSVLERLEGHAVGRTRSRADDLCLDLASRLSHLEPPRY